MLSLEAGYRQRSGAVSHRVTSYLATLHVDGHSRLLSYGQMPTLNLIESPGDVSLLGVIDKFICYFFRASAGRTTFTPDGFR